ncbi:TonB-dependent receptor [Rhodobacter capsulatus]|uniref:TonB-dependent receptor plug domain-containing protein n=1 Tax=Rhodobacter capsulatus TaxID=1061 RepID=UPI000429B786|nr:TonB-dependent receptor plug domain-containing protein [Rhodobacter capsulatus]
MRKTPGLLLLLTCPLVPGLLPGGPALAQAVPETEGGDAATLAPIVVRHHKAGETETSEGAQEVETGEIALFGGVSGDVNAAIAALPGVQDETRRTVDGAFDTGTNSDTKLNLQPSRLSISGGSVNENLFMMNGVSISSTVAAEPFTATPLDKADGSTGINTIYGLHPQSQYIPEAFIEKVEVQTSDISAQYGGFQGGVVNYRLREPSGEKRGLYTFGYTSDALTHYSNGTPEGSNPLGRRKPEWTRREIGFEYETPLSDRTALLFSISRNAAWGRKQLDYQYLGEDVEAETTSDFARLALRHQADDGGVFSLSAAATDYDQDWASNYAWGYTLATRTRARSLTAQYENSFGLWDMTSSLTYATNDVENDSNVDYFANWIGRYYDNTELDGALDWCNVGALTTGYVSCMEGGFTGDKRLDDDSLRADLKFSRALAGGELRFGAAVQKTRASRSRLKDTTAYAAFNRNFSGVCAPGDAFCNADQYAWIKVIYPAYATTVEAHKLEAFTEWEKSWDRIDLRAGLRLDRNDVLDNTDVAPRLSLAFRPNEALRVDLGLNRYYSDDYLAYAIHDNTPIAINRMRFSPTGDWTFYDFGHYRYTQQGLDTPYTDEIKLGMTADDPWSEGVWRLTLLDRHGRDQFAQAARTGADGKEINFLTNAGSSRYREARLEYDRVWDRTRLRNLDSVGLRLSGVFADNKTSASSYYDSDDALNELDLIWYRGTSYSRAEFSELTGNYDIPVRAQVELQTSWKDGQYGLGIGADINFAYDGVRDTDVDETHTNPTYGDRPHSLFEDYRFKTYAQINLSAQARIFTDGDREAYLKLKIANLLDDSAGPSTLQNPWVEGRSVWLGTQVTW